MEQKFDFDTLIDRRGIGSLKWDCSENELPMWVADMDFEVSPSIMKALRCRMDNGTFGYSIVPDEYRISVANWWKRRHGIAFNPAHVVFAVGVIPALISCIRSLSNAGDFVVVQSPVYNNFYTSILNAGRRASENKLVFDDGSYRIDFADLEDRFADQRTYHDSVALFDDRFRRCADVHLHRDHHVFRHRHLYRCQTGGGFLMRHPGALCGTLESFQHKSSSPDFPCSCRAGGLRQMVSNITQKYCNIFAAEVNKKPHSTAFCQGFINHSHTPDFLPRGHPANGPKPPFLRS